MQGMREEQRSGLDYLETVTALLQRIRSTHPTKGLYEAGEVQWWWRNPRPTDETGQLFWFDENDRPAAAVIVTEWSDRTALDMIVMPDSSPEWVAHVVERGLAHARDAGLDEVDLEVDGSDAVMIKVLKDHGFELIAEGFLEESWMDAADRPDISPLAEGFQLLSRDETGDRPHHMISTGRNHEDVEPRLKQTSLYRPDLDLAVFGDDDESAGYGLFWFDPENKTGVVEPMRTEDDHQNKGIARHILTAGIHRLVEAGAERIKIGSEPDNEASSHLYRDVGFKAVKRTDLYAGEAGPGAS